MYWADVGHLGDSPRQQQEQERTEPESVQIKKDPLARTAENVLHWIRSGTTTATDAEAHFKGKSLHSLLSDMSFPEARSLQWLHMTSDKQIAQLLEKPALPSWMTGRFICTRINVNMIDAILSTLWQTHRNDTERLNTDDERFEALESFRQLWSDYVAAWHRFAPEVFTKQFLHEQNHMHWQKTRETHKIWVETVLGPDFDESDPKTRMKRTQRPMLSTFYSNCIRHAEDAFWLEDFCGDALPTDHF